MLKSDEKILVSKELVQHFEEISEALNKCCDSALQQLISNKNRTLGPVECLRLCITFQLCLSAYLRSTEYGSVLFVRLEADSKDKLVVEIREDAQTFPIEINVQSAVVSQEEQIFYTNGEDETEE